ncbi:MAG: 16S rRNA (uracil(1498)-N(3))-methyltransferase [Deltaproteobacteria bacterium]|nr:16S rRNA (uracil(1498)-N(3))-methyltransferase [Deltaproteobacteria bacterium]MBW2020604.1 16S rRNA (uracil(1498)-N(3))-methyltransferase [Deltaproteobacteria bacterium]MBW2075491.1 16S rRNA (uracil(1498)-N(3))-methyltransferase [Deltaproteobacteria bacterium]RLB81566.1 MAG: 16S rRNA (uracil(1498)-N(3))-methyltransferase [Deltaproteobacteria bacterium]
MRRFFLDREKILSDRPTLAGPDVKHIRTVLRLKPGDEIFLFDGEGLEYRARITDSTPDAIILSVMEQSPSITESPVQITIGQALLKARSMDRIVRQVTELGIYAFIPVCAERSVPRPEPGRWAEKEKRWERIARESLKQCGRSQIPRLGPPVSFKTLVGTSKAYDLRIIFHHGKAGLKSRPYPWDTGDMRRVLALIGPEGGFTPEEVKLALEWGFARVSLGPRILKADTAAVAACAILQYAFGDVGIPQKKLDKGYSV